MTEPKPKQVPPGGVIVIAIILISMALLALYANLQKWRRDKIETVITTPIATATPTPETTR